MVLDWGSLFTWVRSQSWAACPLDCAGHTVTSRAVKASPTSLHPKEERPIWVPSGRGRRYQLRMERLAKREHVGNPLSSFLSSGNPKLLSNGWREEGSRDRRKSLPTLHREEVWKQPLPHHHLLQHSEAEKLGVWCLHHYSGARLLLLPQRASRLRLGRDEEARKWPPAGKTSSWHFTEQGGSLVSGQRRCK